MPGRRKQQEESGDKYVKATLVEAAWTSSRKKGTFFQERFNRLVIRKSKKRALIAVGHSFLTAVHCVLSTGGRYKEQGDRNVTNKIEKKRKEYLKAELKNQGTTLSFQR